MMKTWQALKIRKNLIRTLSRVIVEEGEFQKEEQERRKSESNKKTKTKDKKQDYRNS